MTARFLVGIFTFSPSVADSLRQALVHTAFVVSWSAAETEFLDWVVSNRHRIDCLIVQQDDEQAQVLKKLQTRDILLPAIVICSLDAEPEGLAQATTYHHALVHLNLNHLGTLENKIRDAIDQFLKLPALKEASPSSEFKNEQDNQLFLLSLQQQRLSEKLQERLGYLGVYYKRNPQNFLRSMTSEERQEFLEQLRQGYRQIILNYFSNESGLNQRIDDWVNLAFFADVSVSKIVEIHMDLMDDFSKQLHLEGRSEQILLDYRLTLIDVLAHLCEMYRRSIPREM